MNQPADCSVLILFCDDLHILLFQLKSIMVQVKLEKEPKGKAPFSLDENGMHVQNGHCNLREGADCYLY